MKNNETGEFELVLGNRQLLSGFFIVALLFGVAFAMGYIVGRNSTPSPKLQAETAGAANAPAAEKDVRPQPVTPEPQPAVSSAQPPSGSAPSEPAAADTPAQPTTQPAKDVPVTPAAATPAPVPAAAIDDPPAGTYWQVSAIAEPQAQVFAKVLRDKGFHVFLTAGSKNLTRVLVGPYPDTQTLGRAKTDLEGAGFHPVILKKE